MSRALDIIRNNKDEPAIISGRLHSFVLSAAIELEPGLRINAVSPTMVADSAKDYGYLCALVPQAAIKRGPADFRVGPTADDEVSRFNR